MTRETLRASHEQRPRGNARAVTVTEFDLPPGPRGPGLRPKGAGLLGPGPLEAVARTHEAKEADAVIRGVARRVAGDDQAIADAERPVRDALHHEFPGATPFRRVADIPAVALLHDH